MSQSTLVNYIELPANDLNKIKQFYTEAFNWTFTDYGPDYTAFSDSGVLGGFYTSDLSTNADKGSALIVLNTHELEKCKEKILSCGGRIKTDIFSFPGGRRFHFLDPCDNELAVWSEI